MRGERVLQAVVDRDAVQRVARPVAEGLSMADRLQFVAGADQQDALRTARGLNDDGITALIDNLGEHVDEPAVAAAAVDEYTTLLHDVAAADLDAHLSVKPSHLGLDAAVDDPYAFCRDNVRELATAADRHDRFLWIDMESSAYTDDTLDLYTELLDDFDNVGVCIQSYLRRSPDDIQDVVAEDGTIRLVKGAYDEPASVAYQDWDRVGDQYRALLEELFASDTSFAVATHDEELVRYAQELEQEYDRSREEYEFQFLMGVGNDLKYDLVDEGYTVADYVPYGDDWFDYFWRRVQERPQNIRFLAESVTDTVRQ